MIFKRLNIISTGKALLMAVLFPTFYADAQEIEPALGDTLSLREVSVSAVQRPLGLRPGENGVITLNRRGLLAGHHFLGEADALKSLTMVPGFSNSSDYSSGISVDGSSYSQTAMTLDGATIFFPYHFGGIFSTFNTGHLQTVDADRFGTGLTGPARIGGHVAVKTSDRIDAEINGTANVGILASSATLRLPIQEKMQLTVSARKSYLNALYGRFLSTGDNKIIYGLTDLNATLLWNVGQRWRIKANLFMNSDDLTYGDDAYVVDTHLRWRNIVGSVSAYYSGDGWNIANSAGWTSFRNMMSLSVTQFAIEIPSSVGEAWAEGTIKHDDSGIEVGYRVEYNHFTPQYVSAVGTVEVRPMKNVINSWLGMISARKSWQLTSNSRLAASAKVSGVNIASRLHIYVDPRLTYNQTFGESELDFNAGTATQNMHQVGFSDFGMSTNFWLPATADLRPERSGGASVGYRWNGDAHITPSATLFYKRVFREAEYYGDILGLMTDDYNALDFTRSVNGYNAGADATIVYDFGAFSGWVGYGYTLSRRRFPDSRKYRPSAFEPLHSLKIMAQYRLNSHIRLSAYFNYSSGRPYTPIKSIYVFAGNIIAEYGDHNSGHLPAYHRLDLSMTYNFKPFRIGGREINSFLNVSLLNAYGHENVEMRYYTLEKDDTRFRLINSSSLYRFIPSLSYTVEF